ncbi:MAG: glycoside hydrolase family 9 protein [Oscillospiraceae bacterium]|nr:glycoside hydrolase family 9 protein [Oscillospiraceae bacterium]
MRKSKFGKKLASSITALAMVASATAASITTLTASAGELLGEGTFENGAGLPWHICENGTGEMAFEISDGVYSILIKNPGGASNDGEDRWDCQFRHRGLSITYGHKYRITYSVYATNQGNVYAKLGDVTNDDAEYWHNNGNTLDFETYTPGMSMADVETALKGAKTKNGKETGTNQSDWETPYYQGWDKWKSEPIPAKTWVTRSYEFYIDKSFMENTTPPEGKKTVEWTFHFGGDGQYTPEGPCFPADTIIKFDNLVFIDMDGDEDNYPKQEETVKTGLVLNQVGFYPNLDKKATLTVTSGAAPSTFEVKDASGNVVYTGTSSATKEDKTAGEFVQELDFSELKTPGTGYTVSANGVTSLSFDIGDNIYDGLLTDAMNYYYLNRSGTDIEAAYISDSKGHSSSNSTGSLTLARKAGHSPDTAEVSDEWVFIYASEPSYSKSIDVTGGWYDAGDYGKYVVNGGVSMWTLANTYERALATDNAAKWADNSGTVKIPEAGNSIPDILDELMWEADFFKSMMREDGMVYHKMHDYKWTGLGVMPYIEDEYKTDQKVIATKNPKRIVKPATYAATLNAAASWAQLSRLLKDYDATKAQEYLDLAEKAYAAAKKEFTSKYGDIYKETDGDYTKDDMFAPLEQNKGGGPYGDTRVSDEFYWASTELFITSGKDEYGADMRAYKDAFTVPTALYGGENKGDPTSWTWGTLESLGTLSLALNEDKISADEAKKVKEAVQAAADFYLKVEDESGYGTNYKGQDYSVTITQISGDSHEETTVDLVGAYGWGSNSMVANNAIVLGYAYDLTNDVKYLNGAASSFDYLLGRNAMENSYVTGWGSSTTDFPHHRYWCPQMKDGWPYAPSGCLSGGPNSAMNDPMIQGAGYKIGELAPQKCYYDQNDAWSVNEITINWNAPLVWVSSFLEDEGPNAGSDKPEKPDPTDPTTGDVTLWGDADVNNEVSIADVVFVTRTVLGKDNTMSAQGEKNCDIDVDGQLTPADALNVMQLVVELIKQSDCPIKK